MVRVCLPAPRFLQNLISRPMLNPILKIDFDNWSLSQLFCGWSGSLSIIYFFLCLSNAFNHFLKIPMVIQDLLKSQYLSKEFNSLKHIRVLLPVISINVKRISRHGFVFRILIFAFKIIVFFTRIAHSAV